MEQLSGISKILARSDYQQIRVDVRIWDESLVALPLQDLPWLVQEIRAYFHSLALEKSDLYPYFHSNHLELMEKLSERLQGQSFILD